MNSLQINSRINFASVITNFGNALSWTGIPYLVYQETGNTSAFGMMYIFQCFLALGGNLIGGKSSDTFGGDRVVILGSTISAIALLLTFWLMPIVSSPVLLIVFSGFVITVCSSFTDPAMHRLVAQSIKRVNSEFEKSYGKRNSQLMLAKLLGFGLGPIVFSQLGRGAFLVDAMTYFVEIALLVSLANAISSFKADKGGKNTAKKSLWMLVQKHSQVLLAAALSGAVMFPMISIALAMLASYGGDTHISIFWFSVSLGSVISNVTIMKSFKAEYRSQVTLLAVVLISTSIFLQFSFAVNSASVIAIFLLMTLFNPVVNNFFRSSYIRDEDEVHLGSLQGLHEFVFNIGALLGFLLTNVLELKTVLLILTLVSLLRLVPLAIYFKRGKKDDCTSLQN